MNRFKVAARLARMYKIAEAERERERERESLTGKSLRFGRDVGLSALAGFSSGVAADQIYDAVEARKHKKFMGRLEKLVKHTVDSASKHGGGLAFTSDGTAVPYRTITGARRLEAIRNRYNGGNAYMKRHVKPKMVNAAGGLATLATLAALYMKDRQSEQSNLR